MEPVESGCDQTFSGSKKKDNGIFKLLNNKATLFLGDCVDVIGSLKDNSVDLIATDPPYFLDGMGDDWSHTKLKNKQAKSKTVGGLPVGMRFDPQQGKDLQQFMNKVSFRAARALKPGGFFIAFSQGRLFHRMAVGVEDAGFEVRDMLVWEHEGGQGKAFTQNHFVKKMKITNEEQNQIIARLDNRKTPQLRPKFEAMLLAQKPKEGTFVENWLKYETGLVKLDFEEQQTTAFKFDKTQKRQKIDHMTVKPIELMKRVIEVFSKPGQVVLDPFMGSGTTGIAALETGRDFLGIEIEKKYFEIAKKRILEHE